MWVMDRVLYRFFRWRCNERSSSDSPAVPRPRARFRPVSFARARSKRQRTGALHAQADSLTPSGLAPASWSPGVLGRAGAPGAVLWRNARGDYKTVMVRGGFRTLQALGPWAFSGPVPKSHSGDWHMIIVENLEKHFG